MAPSMDQWDLYKCVSMGLLVVCPKCGSSNIKNYIPGEDSGQGAYWPMVWCSDCESFSDGHTN